MAQIANGFISLVFVDSIIPYPNEPYIESGTDTIVAIVDGETMIYVINAENRTKPYEYSRDTADIYFTNDIIVSNKKGSNLYSLCDMKLHKSMNIVKKENKYEKIVTFNMYDDFWHQTYTTEPRLLTPKKCAGFNSNFSQRSEIYEIKSAQTQSIIGHVQICLTKEIQIPIKLLVNYSKDELACPVIYTERTDDHIREIRLLTYGAMEKEVVLQKMSAEILNFLNDK